MKRPIVLVLAAALLLAAGVGTTAAAGPRWRRTANKLGDLLRRELGLAQTATELQEAVDILERERLGVDYDAAILAHAGRESMRRLDSYRRGRAERQDTVSERASAMYKLARGGILRFAFDDLAPNGQTRTAQRVATGRRLRWLVRHDLHELSAYQRAEVRAEAELLAATRELQVLSALSTVQTMQSSVLGEARGIVGPKLRAAKRSRKQVTQSDRTSDRALRAQRDLQREVSKHWRTLKSLKGLGRHGRLVRPVPGKVVGRFGTYKDPVLRLEMVRHGVELRVRADQAVRVIDKGRVVLVSRLPGFEDVVVVDHGAGQFSMTGRLWKVAVAAGDEIERGDVLGHAAPKTVDDGLGRTVYLEVRHGDRPIDPAPYLRRARRR